MDTNTNILKSCDVKTWIYLYEKLKTGWLFFPPCRGWPEAASLQRMRSNRWDRLPSSLPQHSSHFRGWKLGSHQRSSSPLHTDSASSSRPPGQSCKPERASARMQGHLNSRSFKFAFPPPHALPSYIQPQWSLPALLSPWEQRFIWVGVCLCMCVCLCWF